MSMAGFGALVAALAAITSALGVFARGDGAFAAVTSVRGVAYDMATNGVYAFNSKQVVAEGVGWDVFTLVVICPAVLGAMFFVYRGSLRARLAAIGLFGYFVYQYLEYAVTWALGPLFPLYIAIYGLSLIAIVWFATSVAREGVEGRFAADFPRRAYVALNVAMAVLLLAMWSGRIATALGGDLVGAGLLGETTLTVQALDLGLVVPIALVSSYMVLRRTPASYAVAAAYAVTSVAMAAALVAMLTSSGIVSGEMPWPPILIFGAFFAGFALVGRKIYGGISEPGGATDRAESRGRSRGGLAERGSAV